MILARLQGNYNNINDLVRYHNSTFLRQNGGDNWDWLSILKKVVWPLYDYQDIIQII